VRDELEDRKRVVVETTHFVALVPFWATWPFETNIIPKVNVNSIDKLNEEQKIDLSECLSQLLVR